MNGLTGRLLAQAAAAILLVLMTPANAAETPSAITLQLKWHHQFQFAGYYAAVEKGFYRDAGLDVRLVEATTDTDPVQEVVSGRAQYGVGSSALVLARAQGQPVVALATVFQHSPLVLLARGDNGIHSVHDVAGKRVMLEKHAEELIAYLKKEGIERSALDIKPHSLDVKDLIDGRVEVQSAYLTDEPFHFGREAEKYPSFSPRTGGIDFYGDTLFTSEQELASQPDRLAAFRQASMAGWKYAMAHPEEMIDLIIAKYARHHSREQLAFEAKQMVPLIRADLVDIGYMYPGRWQHIVDTYADLGLLPKEFSLRGFLYDPEATQQASRHRLLVVALVLLTATLALGGVTLAYMRWHRRLQRETAARAAMNAELQESERRFRFITEHSGDVIWMMDIASGRFTYISPSVQRLRGYTAEEIMADPVLAAVTPESAERIQAVLGDSIARWHAGERTDTRRVTEVDQPHKDGYIVSTEVVTTLHGDEHGPVSVLGITRDITERKQAEELMRSMAFCDPLTQLPNRRLLLDRLNQSIALAARENTRLALMFIDLDQFKPINDRLGHDTGDWLLQAVAGRMSAAVRGSDTVARIGGDEFIILLPSVKDEDDVLVVAEKIRLALCTPFDSTDGHTLQISSSIGVALYPDHGSTERALLKSGDDAMYQAKAAGRNQVRLAGPGHAPVEEAPQPLVRFHWRSAYESGLPELDREHRGLVDQANALLQAALGPDEDPARVTTAVEALLAQIEQHFGDEETLLERIAYPDRAAHARRHRELLLQATHLRGEAMAGRLSIGDWVDFIARDIVAGHIVREDRKFFPLLALLTSDNAHGNGDTAPA